MNDLQARTIRAQRTAQAAWLGIAMLLVPGSLLAMQHGGGHGGPAPHGAPHPAARPMPSRPAPSMHAQPHFSQHAPAPRPSNPAPGYRPPASQAFRPGVSGGNVQPGRPGIGIGPVTSQPRPAYSMRPAPQAGHLPQWIQQHQNMPIGQQERLLRQEPGFNRLSPNDQQREIQQLQHLRQLPNPQQQRRLARNENIERLSPSERMQLNQSARDYRALPPDRQAAMRNAFRDLRGVPINQRDTVLNSARYSSTFTPQERSMLSNMLRVEPYEAPQ